ncbi:MAG: 3-deoxy-D-manno-octulosonic acid transferase [Deltaproteobacteria bacterium]|nr:3-deoxy-D-manno-octulosonic acid transferase [Deltaproteobacteria bacterium]
MALYDMAGRMLIPFLRKNERLKDGFDQRRLVIPLPAADVWIQAASGGEAYLARAIVEYLVPLAPVRLLVTTNTRQGMEIIEKFSQKINSRENRRAVFAAYFPFDRPSLMATALEQVAPKLTVLLETEIWPGFLYAAKMSGRPIAIVNGRITEKSLRGYRRFKHLLQTLAPERVLAITAEDAGRFAALFGEDIVSVIPNIKFDGVASAGNDSGEALQGAEVGPHPFLVLGSVRQEEEDDVAEVISAVRNCCPDSVIGLFPRHMHRIDHWRGVLDKMGVRWALKSKVSGRVEPGTVLVWDVFGELAAAYAAADSVFVGGSLAPLGGQNFLEPLVFGVVPVIGPFWDNFLWVGEAVFKQGLVIRADGWKAVAETLIKQLQAPADRDVVRRAAMEYIRVRQGGTHMACKIILAAIKKEDQS